MTEEFCLSDKMSYPNGFDHERIIPESDVKEFIRLLKNDLIMSTHKYGTDWCDTLFLGHIDKLAGEKLI